MTLGGICANSGPMSARIAAASAQSHVHSGKCLSCRYREQPGARLTSRGSQSRPLNIRLLSQERRGPARGGLGQRASVLEAMGESGERKKLREGGRDIIRERGKYLARVSERERCSTPDVGKYGSGKNAIDLNTRMTYDV